MIKPGLRARKRHQTHEAIVAAALRVFSARGYDAATLEEVADEANVAKRTLLRYFPSKSHLLLHGAYRALNEFRTSIAERGARSVIDVWEDHVRMGTQRRLNNRQNSDISDLSEREPTVVAEMLKINREYHAIIAAELAGEIHSRYSPEVACNVLAGALVSGQSALYTLLVQDRSYATNVDKIYEVIRMVRDIVSQTKAPDPQPVRARQPTP